jgi:hypothetical protein
MAIAMLASRPALTIAPIASDAVPPLSLTIAVIFIRSDCCPHVSLGAAKDMLGTNSIIDVIMTLNIIEPPFLL